MKAFQLVAAGTTELREVPRPDPQPGEVLVRVGAAGACHSDLHLMEAPAEALEAFPFLAGAEQRLGRRCRRPRYCSRAG